MDFTFNFKDQADLNQTITWFLSKRSLHLENEGEWVPKMLAKTISHSYRSMATDDKDLEPAKIDIPLISLDALNNDLEFLSPVSKLVDLVNSQLKEYVLDFLVHGSIATLDYVKGWSDLDTLVIIKSDTMSDSNKLLTFRKIMINAQDYLTELDPLQHHGFIYCTEFDISHYHSHCMPLEVIEQSKSLLRSSSLTVKRKHSKSFGLNLFQSKVNMFKLAFERGILLHHKYENRYLQEDFKDPETMYQMKYFLAVIMSLPVLYLDALGKPCYKKDSFEEIKNSFQDEWEIIEIASRIRLLWEANEEYPFVGNLIPLWLQKELGPGYFKRAFSLAKAMNRRLASTQ